jgi:iron complex outermembrane receptor protein
MPSPRLRPEQSRRCARERRNDQQRNIDTVRLANKTRSGLRIRNRIRAFAWIAIDAPIFQWLDYQYKDYGGFGKVTDDRIIGGFRNRLVAGVNVVNGEIDNKQYQNIGGYKGALLSSSLDKSKNTSAYIENSFYFLPNVATSPERNSSTRPQPAGSLSATAIVGRDQVQSRSPKAVCSGISIRLAGYASHEAPGAGFGSSEEGGTQVIAFTSIRPQTATTYEIGTRMKRPDYSWEIAAYRANIRDELQCIVGNAVGSCNVTNADRTIHQGIEAGAGAAIFRGIFDNGPAPDKIWLNVAYTLNDFRFDNDPSFATTFAWPRVTISVPSCCTRIRQVSIRAQYRMGAAAYFVTMRTRQNRTYALGHEGGADNGGPMSAQPEISATRPIASASIINRPVRHPLLGPGWARVYAGVKAPGPDNKPDPNPATLVTKKRKEHETSRRPNLPLPSALIVPRAPGRQGRRSRDQQARAAPRRAGQIAGGSHIENKGAAGSADGGSADCRQVRSPRNGRQGWRETCVRSTRD